jgi:hypothetical protein
MSRSKFSLSTGSLASKTPARLFHEARKLAALSVPALVDRRKTHRPIDRVRAASHLKGLKCLQTARASVVIQFATLDLSKNVQLCVQQFVQRTVQQNFGMANKPLIYMTQWLGPTRFGRATKIKHLLKITV